MKANYKNLWFCEKSFESKLYSLIRVRRWKKHLPTYSPDTFDTSKKTVEELIGATCQAEIVHEIIMVLSLLPIALIPVLGGAIALISTSFLSMLFDSLFVILQRYNRPKLIRAINRYEKILNTKQNNHSNILLASVRFHYGLIQLVHIPKSIAPNYCTSLRHRNHFRHSFL